MLPGLAEPLLVAETGELPGLIVFLDSEACRSKAAGSIPLLAQLTERPPLYRPLACLPHPSL
ncbi:MAG TPA: hypothetical protein VGD54_04190 [Steroidobacteraceae bacterium]